MEQSLATTQAPSLPNVGKFNQDVKNIENLAGMYYSSLKYVENTTVDMKFQMEQIEEQLKRKSEYWINSQ